MTATVVVKHRSGAKRGRSETFVLSSGQEILFGRDASCRVRYSNNDDLVSRRHLKIVLAGEHAPELLMQDLGSSNGTFVNGRKAPGPVAIRAGDVVRLGPAGGPEASVEIQVTAPHPDRWPKPARAGKPSGRGRTLLVAAELAALLAAAGFYLCAARTDFFGRHARAAAPVRDSQSAYAGSLVVVERRWTLVDAYSGRALYQLFAPNQTDPDSRSPLVKGAGAWIPVFVRTDQTLEPVLTTRADRAQRGAVGGVVRTTGFFAAADTVVTTAEPWEAIAELPNGSTPGMLLAADARFAVTQRAALLPQLFPGWTAGARDPIVGDIHAGAVELGGRLQARISSATKVLLENGEARATSLPAPESPGVVAMRVQMRDIRPLRLSPEPHRARYGDPIALAGYPAVGLGTADRAKPIVLSTRITRLTASGFELAPVSPGLCPGAAALNASGNVIGILEIRDSRWFAAPVRFRSGPTPGSPTATPVRFRR